MIDDEEGARLVRDDEDDEPLWSQDENELVCPYCGYSDPDAWELHDDDGETECGHCDKTFRYSREVSVKYSTRRIKQEDGDVDETQAGENPRA